MPKSLWIRDGCDTYVHRIEHYCRFERRIVKSGSMSQEHERLQHALRGDNGVLVLLDERGAQKTSVEFSHWLGMKKDHSVSLTFVIEGAYGLSDALRSRGSLLSLSRMTLPHELCQLLFLEQLYRAHTLLHGGKYHHG